MHYKKEISSTDFFNRQIKLVGEEKQKSLETKHILIIGCGGLGCSNALALGSSGIGKITLLDFDTISITNIHRQLAFRTSDVDKYKSEVLGELLLERNPFLEVEIFKFGFDELIDKNKYQKYDLMQDSTDNLIVRQNIDKFAKDKNIPWIYGSVEEFNGQICFFDKSSFNEIFVIKENLPKGITAPMLMNISSLQSLLALKYLYGFDIKKDLLYYAIIKDDEFILQKFKLPPINNKSNSKGVLNV